MKTKSIILATLFLLLVSGGGRLSAQQLTTMGTDFWVTSIGRGYSNIQLLFASQRNCSASIVNPYTGWDTTISIDATAGKYFSLYHYNISYLSGETFNYGFHITTTDTVSLYIITGSGSNSESSNILPTQVLGKYYIIQTYPTPLYTFWGHCLFSIVTTEDSTNIRITLNGPTSTGEQTGETITRFLPSAGTCFQIISGDNADLSGTKVISNKKIAIFQGNSNSNVSIDGFYSTDGNHLFFEQAIPVKEWGRHFIVPHSGYNSVDKVRITAKDGLCSIFRNGQFLANLIACGTYEYALDSSSLADQITTTKAANITLYNTTDFSTAVPGYQYCIRTASSTTIYPLKDATKYVSFYFKNEPSRVNIVAHTSDTNLIFLDTINIGNLFIPIENNRSFSIARIQDISEGFHTLYAQGGSGFNAYYTYPDFYVHSCSLGASFPTIQNSLNIENITDANLFDTINGCINQIVTMSVSSEISTDSIRWFLGDGSQDNGTNVQHLYNHDGIFPITAIVYSSCQECYKTVDTQQATIRIYPNSITYLDTIYSCDSLLYHNLWYKENSLVSYDTLSNAFGCDSLIFHNIVIKHSYNITENVTIPDTATFTWIDGNTYSESTDEPYIVMQAVNGCDSTIHLHLTVLPTPPPSQIDSTAIWIPNVFTPGEETNQRFRFYCHDIQQAQVSIFNRKGLHIVTFDALADSWDGTCNGRPCPQDSYVYIIEYTTVSNPHYKQRKTGTVTLLR